jgi:hypothetical protein
MILRPKNAPPAELRRRNRQPTPHPRDLHLHLPAAGHRSQKLRPQKRFLRRREPGQGFFN